MPDIQRLHGLLAYNEERRDLFRLFLCLFCAQSYRIPGYLVYDTSRSGERAAHDE